MALKIAITSCFPTTMAMNLWCGLWCRCKGATQDFQKAQNLAASALAEIEHLLKNMALHQEYQAQKIFLQM